jgi:hypothetical protein
MAHRDLRDLWAAAGPRTTQRFTDHAARHAFAADHVRTIVDFFSDGAATLQSSVSL